MRALPRRRGGRRRRGVLTASASGEEPHAHEQGTTRHAILLVFIFLRPFLFCLLFLSIYDRAGKLSRKLHEVRDDKGDLGKYRQYNNPITSTST
jgi:hypothetical protein